MASSKTGGVKPMSIAGRYVSERERLNGMTDAERKFRAQYLKDQILSPNEPRHVPELARSTLNPIRRFYRYPLDKLCEFLTPKIGFMPAYHVRFWTGKGLITLSLLYGGYYYFKYHTNDWTKKGGWRVTKSRLAVLPGDKDYPKVSDRSRPSDYNLRGFDKSPI